MNKLKEFFIHQNLKWRYSNETVPFFARKGLKIGIGLAFLTIGIIVLVVHTSVPVKANYQAIETTPIKALKAIDATGQTHKLTLVLYRDDCQACQHVEKELSGKIQTIRKNKQAKIVVTDLKKMNQDQLRKIQQKLPEIMVDGTKIPTPLVANLVIKKDGTINVKQQSNTDDFKDIENVLDKAVSDS